MDSMFQYVSEKSNLDLVIVAPRTLHSVLVRVREVKKRPFRVGGVNRYRVRGFSNVFCVFEKILKNV